MLRDLRRSPLVLLVAIACVPGPEGSTSAPEPTRIALADTIVVALYGTGERPSPPCTISVEVSDAAFEVEAGDVVEVMISRCGDEGSGTDRGRRLTIQEGGGAGSGDMREGLEELEGAGALVA